MSTLGSSWSALEDACYSWFGKPEQTYLRDLANRERSQKANDRRWRDAPWRLSRPQKKLKRDT